MAVHTIAHDIIAQVSGPGWSYGLARIVIDTEGNAAVFVPPGDAPVQQFTTTGSGLTGRSTDGSVVWKRRGASCSFALAKCNTSTPTLAKRWNANG